MACDCAEWDFEYQSFDLYGYLTVQYCDDSTASTIRREYNGRSTGSPTWDEVSWKPACSDITTSGSSTHFSWSELTDHSPGNSHYPYAIIKSDLWTALEATRTAYGDSSGLHIESGYRNPLGNASISPKGAGQSRHMWGDAVDMWPIGQDWNFGTWDALRAVARANGFTYNEEYSDDPSHLHVDLR
jgi:hypothetical protein